MTSTVKRKEFWDTLEEKVVSNIPVYIKQALKLESLDDLYILKQYMKKKTIQELKSSLEITVRSRSYFNTIPEGSKLEEYYGEFGQNPTDFKFSLSDNLIIQRIIEAVLTNPIDFWTHDKNSRKLKFLPKKCSLLEMFNYSSFVNKDVMDTRGHRYDAIEGLKEVSAYFLILGGRLLYRFLCKHLPIPNERTVSTAIGETVEKVVEGSLRVEALKQFLVEYNAIHEVWISEDATGVINKVEYDSISNTLVGFILPQDNNSMPIQASFKASSAKAIKDYFDNQKVASLLYIYMAQANDPRVPPFCLLFYGSDNTMHFTDAQKRLKFITNELKKHDIKVLGYSADGDTRVLKAMRLNIGLGTQLFKSEEDRTLYEGIKDFHATFLTDQVPIQDTVHITNRLRTRLFKPSILLPMGNYIASSNDIITLAQYCLKDKHRLNYQDLTSKDKMNFATTLKICHPRIWSLLEKHVPDKNVPGSQGTQLYLKVAFYSTQAMLSTQLTPLQRIHCMWYSIYVLRMWRAWLRSKREQKKQKDQLGEKGYSETDNFITTNCYTGLELNAHGLLNLILKCAKENDFNNFFPWMYSSQACEGFFRNLRSLSSTMSMMVNCSILAFSYRMRRLDMLAKIYCFNYMQFPLVFPRTRFLNGSHEKQNKSYAFIKQFSWNANETYVMSIIRVLNDAKLQAYDDLIKLGMDVDLSSATNIQHKFNTAPGSSRACMEEEENDDDEDDDEIHEHEYEYEYEYEYEDHVDDEDEELSNEDFEGQIHAPPSDELDIFAEYEEDTDFPQCPERVEKRLKSNTSSDDNFTAIKDKRNQVKFIRKSSLCWFFNNHKKLSSDRLTRVKETGQRQSSLHLTCRSNITNPVIQSTINICDYCVFQTPGTNNYLIGLIKDFSKILEKDVKNRRYFKRYAEISDANKVAIGVSAMWFSINRSDNTLQVCPMEEHGFIPLQYYRLTIPPPVLTNDKRNVITHSTVLAIETLQHNT